MSEIIILILALLAGVGLGIFYYGGLYYTLRYLPASRNPVLLTIGSFIIRSAIVVAGMYWVMGHNQKRIIVAFIGFVLAMVVARASGARPFQQKDTDLPREMR